MSSEYMNPSNQVGGHFDNQRLNPSNLVKEFWTMFRYGLVGLMNTGVFALFAWLLRNMGLHYTAYTAIAYCIAILFSFLSYIIISRTRSTDSILRDRSTRTEWTYRRYRRHGVLYWYRLCYQSNLGIQRKRENMQEPNVDISTTSDHDDDLSINLTSRLSLTLLSNKMKIRLSVELIHIFRPSK